MFQSGKKIFFVLAVGIFFISRLDIIFLSYGCFSLPRLGDDSLYYLWKGHSLWEHCLKEEPVGSTDLLNDAQLLRDAQHQRHASERIDALAWRMILTLKGMFTPLHDFLAGAALKAFSPDLKKAFVSTELMGAGVMTFAWAFFLIQFFSIWPAILTLVFLTFVRFPNQGLHFFIPSTLSLSFVLITVGLYWKGMRAQSRTLLGLASVVAFCSLATHLMATLYLSSFFLLFFVYIWLHYKKTDRHRRLSQTVVVFFLPLIVWIALRKFFDPLKLPDIQIGLDLSLWGLLVGFYYNLVGFYNIVLARSLVYVGPIVLCVWAFRREVPKLTQYLKNRRGLRLTSLPVQCFVLGAVFLSLFLSFFHKLPGYPAEAASRVWTLLIPLVLCFGLEKLLQLEGSLRRIKKSLPWVILLIVILPSVLPGYLRERRRECFNGANETWFTPELGAAKAWIEAQDDGEGGIIYGEDDVLIRGMFSLGWDTRHAASLTFLSKQQLETVAVSRNLKWLLLPWPRALTYFDSVQEKRKRGFLLEKGQVLRIAYPGSKRRSLYLIFENLEKESGELGLRGLRVQGRVCGVQKISEGRVVGLEVEFGQDEDCYLTNVEGRHEWIGLLDIESYGKAVTGREGFAWPWGQRISVVVGNSLGSLEKDSDHVGVDFLFPWGQTPFITQWINEKRIHLRNDNMGLIIGEYLHKMH